MTDARQHQAIHTAADGGVPATQGRVLHAAAAYDLLAWAFLLGREPAFRRRILDLARLEPGDSVLDVGCGTGSLMLLAKKVVGPRSTVHGIDASPEMIVRATAKAKRAGLDVTFQNAVVEALPFTEGTFDVVLSTLMLHHLPRTTREQCAREMRRVLKSGGRVVLIDFGAPEHRERRFLPRLHRHGHVELAEMIRVLVDAGFRITETGEMGMRNLAFVLAVAP